MCVIVLVSFFAGVQKVSDIALASLAPRKLRSLTLIGKRRFPCTSTKVGHGYNKREVLYQIELRAIASMTDMPLVGDSGLHSLLIFENTSAPLKDFCLHGLCVH